MRKVLVTLEAPRYIACNCAGHHWLLLAKDPTGLTTVEAIFPQPVTMAFAAWATVNIAVPSVLLVGHPTAILGLDAVV